MDLHQMIGEVVAEHRFAGVVRVDESDGSVSELACGAADRTWSAPWTTDTRFGIASGTKTFTALAVVSLLAEGRLAPGSPVRDWLGDDLPEIDDRVTVEQLLAHRSGIGDYFDESAFDDIATFVPPVPVQQLTSTAAYLPMLEGFPMVAEPGSTFAYNNGGYVVLALVVERVTGQRFEHVVDERVCRPAGLVATGFLRSDEPSPGTATGYLDLDGSRTNVFHLPLLGSGDGGLSSTTADIVALWRSLAASRIVPLAWVERMTTAWSVLPSGSNGYGWGCWLPTGADAVQLEGMDAGVSFRSTWHRRSGRIVTVASNTAEGAWPILDRLEELLGSS